MAARPILLYGFEALSFMKIVASILNAHPSGAASEADSLALVLEALARCEQVCLLCADACLEEESMEKLRSCIRLNFDCAAICSVTAQLLVRRTEIPGTLVHAQLHACVIACQSCADLCATHASYHHHCEICTNTCRDCQEQCNRLIGDFPPSGIIQFQQ